MAEYFKFQDTLNGSAARCMIEINGNLEFAFYVKSLEINSEKQKTDGKTLGNLLTQSKAAGIKNTGSMTIYYATTAFADMIEKYQNSGIDTYFPMVIENDDPGSTVGKQVIRIEDCNIDSAVIAKIDIESEALDHDIDFTCGKFTVLSRFKKPVLAQ